MNVHHWEFDLSRPGFYKILQSINFVISQMFLGSTFIFTTFDVLDLSTLWFSNVWKSHLFHFPPRFNAIWWWLLVFGCSYLINYKWYWPRNFSMLSKYINESLNSFEQNLRRSPDDLGWVSMVESTFSTSGIGMDTRNSLGHSG